MDALHIVVIDTDADRAAMIRGGLEDEGEYRVSIVSEMQGLAARLARLDADIVLIGLENPNRDTLEQLTAAAGPSERPVAMFVDRSDRGMMQAAIAAGVSAYVVDGLRRDRVRPVLETAIARFHSFARLQAELTATKAALAERKTIDRAKGILMKARGIDEEAAYALLRKTAMDQGKRVAELAEGLVTAAGLLS
ncbi:ANTAR domain-containing response regulator [Oceanicella sp. SM1341]|uniref:ANTAR domain-containing response regulator n=1 Tax=Oceanicella sp. SM1341 TaxID=1548889 RepID=UPI000E50D746|nr:ANTAR domain-containing protein [Oceanicella sp. SM1341]